VSEVTIPPLAIRRHAAARPLALAVRDAVGDLTFGQLDRAADMAAGALRERGVARGDRVALLAVPSGEAIALVAGIARCGAVAVPLGTRLTRREVVDALEEATPALLIHDADLAAVAGGHGVPAIAPAALLAAARVAMAPGAPAPAIPLGPSTSAVDHLADSFEYFANSWTVVGLPDYRDGTRISPRFELVLGGGTTVRGGLTVGGRITVGRASVRGGTRLRPGRGLP